MCVHVNVCVYVDLNMISIIFLNHSLTFSLYKGLSIEPEISNVWFLASSLYEKNLLLLSLVGWFIFKLLLKKRKTKRYSSNRSTVPSSVFKAWHFRFVLSHGTGLQALRVWRSHVLRSSGVPLQLPYTQHTFIHFSICFSVSALRWLHEEGTAKVGLCRCAFQL